MKSVAMVLISMMVALLASACTSAQPITEPVAVIEAFFEELNDGDLDAAMSFVADDANFILFNVYPGKAEIRDFYEEGLNLGYLAELSDLRADGDTVSWAGRVTIGGGVFEDSYEAVVQEGMIVSLTFR